MESVHKQQKNLTEEVDKLSNLPSCVVGHILSFLPTKDAIRTSILATSWKNYWKSITNLDFENRSTNRLQAGFVNFVYTVLFHVKSSCLKKFSLDCCCDIESDGVYITTWILSALSRNVQELDINNVGLDEVCFLPTNLFKCRALVKLRLFEGFLDVPSSISLPNLEELYVSCIKFNDEDACTRLLSCSRVLKTLTVERCDFTNVPLVKIFSHELKELFLYGREDSPKSRFVLDAPRLEYVDYVGFIPENGTLKNLDNLREAHIDLYWTPIRNFITQVYDDLNSKPAVFPQLKELNYNIDDVHACHLLKNMVENSPQLEWLFIFFDTLVPHENISPSIFEQLKVVEIYISGGDGEELEFLKHILKNAVVLEVLHIYAYNHIFREELLAFPRSSASCRIIFDTR